MSWTAREIVNYLDEHHITLVVFGGVARLEPGLKTTPQQLRRIQPEFEAHTDELLEYFEGLKNATNEPTRDDVINAAMHRGAAAGKVVYLLLPTGLAVELADAGGKALRKQAEEANWVAVAGDEKWTRLPNPPDT